MLRKIRTALSLLKDPKKIIAALGRNGLLNWIPDKPYIKLMYYCETGKKLNLENPQTFNEKLQWLKLYDRKPEYTIYADKYAVREYIANTIGEEYLIPLIGVYETVDEIPWNDLLNQFVLKCTHGSGYNIICKDKSKLNVKEVKQKLNQWLKKNYYWSGREWPYKNIKPRIICEKYMVDESGTELKDYKFFCFDGEPKLLYIATDRGIDTRFDFYDIDFNHLALKQHYKNASKRLIKPKNFNNMVDLSRIVSKNIPHVRVDFYCINGKIYLGELTFYHFCGYEKFEPEEYDKILGSWIKLPTKTTKITK